MRKISEGGEEAQGEEAQGEEAQGEESKDGEACHALSEVVWDEDEGR